MVTDAVAIKAQPPQSGVSLEAFCYGLVKKLAMAWSNTSPKLKSLRETLDYPKSILYARHEIGLLVLLVLFMMNVLVVPDSSV